MLMLFTVLIMIFTLGIIGIILWSLISVIYWCHLDSIRTKQEIEESNKSLGKEMKRKQKEARDVYDNL